MFSVFRIKMKYLKVVLLLLVAFVVSSHATCKKVLARGVTTNDKNIIIKRHNEIRLMLANKKISSQPKASNLKRMSWDNYLAQQAQNIADTCVFAHVKVSDNRFSVGQNLFWSGNSVSNTTANWLMGIDSWFNEYKTYAWAPISEANRPNWHYTQLAWANTHLVGCGYTNYVNTDGWYEKLYVCNYGPAGNYLGQYPYKTGAGCENLC